MKIVSQNECMVELIKNFYTREELVQAITEYMNYYTNDRPQRGLGILTPMEFYEKQLLVA